jgi:hypothetical protein
MPSEERFTALAERLGEDSKLGSALELDAVTTLRDRGFEDLAPAVEQERDRIADLVDRIYADDEFRRSVEEQPTATLIGWGIPEAAVGNVLVLAGAPDDVVELASADVEAHLLGKKPATIAAMGAMLGALAFAQQTSAASQPARAGAQFAPAAKAQLAPAARAQLAPAAARVQVSPAAKAHVSNAQVRWQGVQPNQLKAQGELTALLRAQGLVR